MQERARRFTIGMPVMSLGDPYTDALIQGAARCAAARDVNLVVMLLDGFDALDYPAEHAEELGAYALLAPTRAMESPRLDGLVLTAGLAYRGDRPLERLQALRSLVTTRPMVGASLQLEGLPTVVADSYVGMREAVVHLIEVHGYRRIAFIAGPAASEEAQDRYRAYADALADHGIELDEALVAEGDYTPEGGARAMAALLEREATPDAVVCASDDTAVGAFETLQALGIEVPDDLALVGFDDSRAARRLPVPLTTVRQPVQAIGFQAAGLLISILREEIAPTGSGVGTPDVVPTHLVTRRSCGCYPAHVQALHLGDPENGPLGGGPRLVTYDAYRPEIVSELTEVTAELTGSRMGDVSNAPKSSSVTDAMTALVDAFWEDLRSSDARGGTGSAVPVEGRGFVDLVAAELQRSFTRKDTGVVGADITVWHTLITRLRQMMVPLLSERRHWMRAEDLLQQARALVDEARLQRVAQREMMLEQRRYLVQDFSGRVAQVLQLEEAVALMGDILPALDITACYLSTVGEGPGSGRGRARWVAAYEGGLGRVVDAAAPGASFEMSDLVPPDVWRAHRRRFTALVVPLNVGERVLGVGWFEGAWQADEASALVGGRVWFDTYPWLGQAVGSVLLRSQLVTETQRRAARLAASAEVSSATTSITDLDVLLPEAVDRIRDRFDLVYAGIFLTDPQNTWAVLVAGTGEAGRTMIAQGHRLRVGGQSMIGACVAEGEARVTVDTTLEDVWRPNPLLPGIRSELALPLISRAQVIGAMTIQDTAPGAFTEEDVTTFQTLADQLANAIENARLFEQMDQSLRDLQAATGQFTERAWRDYVRSRRQGIGYRRQLLGTSPVTDLHPEADQALARGEVVVSPIGDEADGAVDGGALQWDTGSNELGGTSTHGGTSAAQADGGIGLGVPIRLRDQILGVLNLRFENDYVPPETVQLVEQVADRLAMSLETARLLEVTQRSAQRERLIGAVTQRMRESLAVDEVLQRSTQEIREAMDLFKVSVRLAPQESGHGGDTPGGTSTHEGTSTPGGMNPGPDDGGADGGTRA